MLISELKVERQAARISGMELAVAAGISQARLSYLERGILALRPGEFDRLTSALRDIKAQRLRFSVIERGLYRDAHDFCLIHGSIPADPTVLKRNLACTDEEFSHGWTPAVAHEFEPDPVNPGRLVNRSAQAKVAESEAFRIRQSLNGAKGGRPKSQTKPSVADLANPNLSETAEVGKPKEKPIRTTEALPDHDGGESLQDPYDWFVGAWIGPIPENCWQAFGESVNTPERLAFLRANVPLWLKTRNYRDGFHNANAFLKSGVWLRPPRPELLQPPKIGDVFDGAEAIGGDE